MKTFNSQNAPKAVGPYSHAVVVGDLIFTSGQIALNPKTNEMNNSSIEDETNQVCQNLEAILKDLGSSMDKVIKTTVFITDMDKFKTINEIYANYFTNNPARSCVMVSKLPKGANIEIEVIALK
ncbi:MAG: RidA family protein [Anaeroplasmataceae bacterium]